MNHEKNIKILKAIRRNIESAMENEIDNDKDVSDNIIFELAQLHIHISKYLKIPWHVKEDDYKNEKKWSTN